MSQSKSYKASILAALMVGSTTMALGAVSSEEAKKLGTTLTPWGAEMAANKDGSIPAYTGGLTTPPPGWDKSKPGQRPDPFASEKPLFSITAKNMDQYGDKLTDGSRAMLKRYPTFRIDVYPTHRTAAFPKNVQDNTIKNATRCKSSDDGLAIENCFGGLPFPIPKTGHEAMWNAVLRYSSHALSMSSETWYSDGAGRATLASANEAVSTYPNYDPKATSADKSWLVLAKYVGPARTAGEAILVIDPMNYVNDKRRAYQYIPGQRRVKLAPDLAYDTPAPNSAGLITMDQPPVWSGPMDRFDFKLLGKREIFIPYNTYKMGAGGDAVNCGPEKFIAPGHWSPDCIRWELHRVHVVESTVKPGKRHIYAKRIFYLDEDGANGSLTDMYDASGQLYRVGFTLNRPMYEAPGPLAEAFGTFDLLAGTWVINNWDRPGLKGVFPIESLPANQFTPEAMAGAGIR
jgi:hypothetical protein